MKDFLKTLILLLLLSSFVLTQPVYADDWRWSRIVGVIDRQGKEIIPSKFNSIKQVGSQYYLAKIYDFDNPLNQKTPALIFDEKGRKVSFSTPKGFNIKDIYLPNEDAVLTKTRLLNDSLFVLKGESGEGLFVGGKFEIPPEKKQIFFRQVNGYIPLRRKSRFSWHKFAINMNTMEINGDPDFLKTLNKNADNSDPQEWVRYSARRGKEMIWGYKNPSGDIVIDAKYENAKPFAEDDLAQVWLADSGKPAKTCLINRSGQRASPVYDILLPFHNGFAVVSKDDVFSIIDKHFRPKLNRFVELRHLYKNVYFSKKTKNDKPLAINLNGKTKFEFPSNVISARHSDGLILCGTREEGKNKFGTVCLNQTGKIVFNSQEYNLIELKKGLATFFRKAPQDKKICVIVDKDGLVSKPFEADSVKILSKNRFEVWQRNTHFPSKAWKSNKSAPYRHDMFANLLREYDLIAMPKEKLEKLLGQPKTHSQYNHEFYEIGLPRKFLEFDFYNDAVRAWRYNYPSNLKKSNPDLLWITTNVVYDWYDSTRIGQEPVRMVYPKPEHAE